MQIVLIDVSPVPQRRVRNAIGIGLACFCALLPLRVLFTPNDHAGYSKMVENVDRLADDGEVVGKERVAFFYSQVNRVVPYYVLTNFALLGCLVIFAWHSKNWVTIGALLLLVAPLSPYFGYITKEAMLLLLLLVSYCVRRRSVFFASVVFYLLAGAFGLLVRKYYVPFLLLGFGWARVGLLIRTFVLLVGVVVCLFFAGPVFRELLSIKKQMWERLAFNSNVNTLLPLEFTETLPFFDVLYLWLQNIFYLLTTVVRVPGVPGVASLVSLVTVSVCFLSAFQSADKRIWYFAFFTLVFMTYLVPDSGTFVRHSTMLGIFAVFSVLLGKSHEA